MTQPENDYVLTTDTEQQIVDWKKRLQQIMSNLGQPSIEQINAALNKVEQRVHRRNFSEHHPPSLQEVNNICNTVRAENKTSKACLISANLAATNLGFNLAERESQVQPEAKPQEPEGPGDH